MKQKVSAREIAAVREMEETRAGTVGMEQCDGCPERVLVRPGRPGHLSDCSACHLHCQCYRIPDGIS